MSVVVFRIVKSMCWRVGVELQSYNVIVTHAAVRAGASVPMCIMNPTDHDITLYKGTKIATVVEPRILIVLCMFPQYRWLRVCQLNCKQYCGENISEFPRAGKIVCFIGVC